jgi:hypothetical protein
MEGYEGSSGFILKTSPVVRSPALVGIGLIRPINTTWMRTLFILSTPWYVIIVYSGEDYPAFDLGMSIEFERLHLN